jgi:hypothetical protein
MKKTLILLYTIITCHVVFSQPCTPPTTFPGNQGILPLSLGFAYLDTAYSQIIEFKAPLDTSVSFGGSTVNFRVDSLRIVSVQGLPNGINYQCHTSNCMVNGGQIGCAVLSGQATQAGVFPLNIIIRTSGTVQSFIPLPITNTDTNQRYTLFVYPRTGIAGILKNNSKLQVYPNPTKGFLNIQTGPTFNGNIRVFDLSGKIVYEQQLVESLETIRSVYTLEWTKGIYIVEWHTGETIYRERVVIN